MKSQSAIRPEIQALRAIAVAAVVLFHLWPNRLTGGYVGVDVFFVISGFLITAHLLREASASGTVSLSRFYARRIRRLLPAAFLVLFVTAAGVLTLAPTRDWAPFLKEIAASGLYVVNWMLGFNAVDYFAADDAPSPVQHYWSLSVEEQFYLVWPLLLVIVFALTSKRVAARGAALAGVLWTVFAACLAYSIIVTPIEPGFAYFATPAHGWELAAGGLLAFYATRLEASRFQSWDAARGMLSWLGLVAIIVPFFLFDADTIFPGWIALIPVAGAVAVIAAGDPAVAWSPVRVLRLRPVQFVGDTSYASYLWHWPIIVLAPLLLVRELTAVDKVAIIGLTLVLAWLTRRFVERPVIEGTAWRRRRVSFAFAGVATAALLVTAITPQFALEERAAVVRAEVADTFAAAAAGGDENLCLGAPALESAGCDYRLDVNPAIGIDPENLKVPAVTTLEGPDGKLLAGECKDGPFGSQVCVKGSKRPEAVIALVGDSHASALGPALDYQPTVRNWQVHSYTKRSCPIVEAGYHVPDKLAYKANNDDCVKWRDWVIDEVEADPSVDVIVVASFGRRYAAGGEKTIDAMGAAMSDTWKRWAAAGKQVVVTRDVPLSTDDVIDCVAGGDPAGDCSRGRDRRLGPEPLERSVTIADSSDVALLDLTSGFCDEKRCYAVVGGLLVYEDRHHLTPAYSRSLGPLITPSLDAALERHWSLAAKAAG